MKVVMSTYCDFLLPWVLIICCLETSLSGQNSPQHQMLYRVAYSDGRTIEGARIQKDHFFAHSRSNAHLDNQLIFLPDNHVRLIRNLRKKVFREGPYIEFVNGDILPGRVEGIGMADPGRNTPDHLQIRLSAPLKNHAGQNNSLINVRAEHVARLVTRTPEKGSAKSGYIRLESGASIEVRSIRWRPNEIRALTTQGVRTIPIRDVVELRRPVEKKIRWMLAGNPEVGFDSPGHRVMFQTVNGARLTTREAKMVRYLDSGTMIQPSWALDAIMLAPEDIVDVLFLRFNEIPLAVLPAETLLRKSCFGTWKWVRNHNVLGGRLDSGDRDSPIGVGMHACTAVAFYLPPGAQSFSSWVGLDRAVGNGGCAIASVYLNDLEGEPVWRSDYLQGGNPSVRVGPLSVKKRERLVLVADFGHEGRPRGADPFDIRDFVDWIDPIVETMPSDITGPKLEEIFPFPRGWTLSEKDRARLSPTQIWNPHEGRWVHAWKCPAPPAPEKTDQKQPALLGKPGVYYEYYENYRGASLPDFDKLTPKARGIVPAISLPIPNVQANHMALRFKSTLVVPRDEFYEFYLRSDDGSRMYINGRLLIANDGMHGPTEKVGRIALRKGGAPIQVEYFDGGGEQHLSLEWRGPGSPRRSIGPKSFDLAPLAGLDLGAEYTAIEPIILNRHLEVTSSNAWLSMYAGRNEDGIGDYELEVRVNGKPIRGMTGRNVHTKQLQPMQLTGGVWHLGNNVGRTITLQVAVKPLGYRGHEIPALHIKQLETGPKPEREADRSISKDLLGRWRLRGMQSKMNKSYHAGLLSGGDGTLRLADDGTVSMWLRLPSGDQKAAAGYVVREDGRIVFDYINADWTRDQVQRTSDRKSLIVEEQADRTSWHLVFTQDELSSFDEFVGQWTLQGETSRIHNAAHDGALSGGEGRLSIGPDGGFRLWLQYPPNAQGQVRDESSTGRLVLKGGNMLFEYDAEGWSDDRGEWHADKRQLTLREIGNEEKWILSFLKQ